MLDSGRIHLVRESPNRHKGDIATQTERIIAMTNSIFTTDLENAHVAYGKAMLAGEKAGKKLFEHL